MPTPAAPSPSVPQALPHWLTHSAGPSAPSTPTANDHPAARSDSYFPQQSTPDEREGDGHESDETDVGCDELADALLEGPRHGFDEAYYSQELADMLPLLPYFTSKRHLTGGNPHPVPAPLPDWRLRERLKTVTAALVLCLNIGVDPPDVVKTQPCAKLECWVDPFSVPPSKALEAIGKNLQSQFETLSQRSRIKQYLDPSVEETRKFCANLRRNAKEERVLLYYNGHGVPKPTTSGEIWVFNKTYTQYIPVSLYDLQSWIGSPGIYVWDCSAAGNILQSFLRFAERRDAEIAAQKGGAGGAVPGSPDKAAAAATADGKPDSPQVFYAPLRDSIQLAACAPDQVLPMTPELPADLFTSCLTSPIEIALRYFVLQDPLPTGVDVDMVMKIPGDLKDRRTPLGELNWIFTAVTDTIAWTTFPRDIFKRLFRQDLMVAALFRNFLLAERIMRTYHCTPMSHPKLPPTYDHPLWQSWDLAVDACISQLPDLLKSEKAMREGQFGGLGGTPPPTPYVYRPSTFFTEHLTAFEVWLARGSSSAVGPATSAKGSPASGRDDHDPPRKPPDQLPIVLQVLLSQAHRLRALILLSQFVDLGPWAVNLALSIGIFPYVQRLLQSPAAELKPVLIFIWARILAVDRTCQTDLLKDNGFTYFANVLSPFQGGGGLPIPNVSEHRAMCAFILSMFCRDFRPGQMACFSASVFEMCIVHLEDEDYLLRQWSALCLGQLWDGNDEGRAVALREGAPEKLCAMLNDVAPEVRAAVLFALGTFMGASGSRWEHSPPPQGVQPPRMGGGGTGAMHGLPHEDHLRLELRYALAGLAAKEDASPMVRKELLVFWSALVREWSGWFVLAAYTYYAAERQDEARRAGGDAKGKGKGAVRPSPHAIREAIREHEGPEQGDQLLASFVSLFIALLDLSVDPYPEVASHACTIVDFISALLLESPLADARDSALPPPPAGTSSARRSPAPSMFNTRHPYSPFDSAFQPPHQSQLHPPPTPNGSLTQPPSPTLARDSPAPIRRSGSLAAALNKLTSFPSLSGAPSPSRSDSGDAANGHVNASGFAQVNGQPSPHFNHAVYHSPYGPSPPDTPASDSAHHPPNRTASTDSLRALAQRANHARAQSSSAVPTLSSLSKDASDRAASNVTVADAVMALLDEDDARLRKRKEKGQPPSQHPPPSPSLPPSRSRVELEENMGIVLPLKSRYYEWCCEYYTESQMRNAEADEPGSVKYNEQLWRRQRNERIISETQIQAEVASSREWESTIGHVHERYVPVKLTFHQFEPHLITADEHDTLSIWDWQAGRRLNTFSNGNPLGTNITTVKLINEDVEALLLTASAEGHVRIFRDYDKAGGAELASSFRATSELIPSRHPSGLVAEWQQATGNLFVGGDMRSVRVWDAHHELFHSDIPTMSRSCLTAITSDQDMGHIFIAGFGDGTVRVFDRRHNPRDACVRHYREHLSWVQNIHLQRGGNRELVSGSIDGDVRLWDIRGQGSISSMDAHREGMSCIDMHEHASVFATSSMLDLTPSGVRTQSVKIWKIGQEGIAPKPRHITIPTGLHAAPTTLPFNPSVSSLAFHPNEMALAIGAPDGNITVLGCPVAPVDEVEFATAAAAAVASL